MQSGADIHQSNALRSQSLINGCPESRDTDATQKDPLCIYEFLIVISTTLQCTNLLILL